MRRTTLILAVAIAVLGVLDTSAGAAKRRRPERAEKINKGDIRSRRPKARTTLRETKKRRTRRAAGRRRHGYRRGVLHRKSGPRAAVARPPVRARFRAQPRGGVTVRLGPTRYSYFRGTLYWRNPGLGLSVSVGAPIGAVVPVLPPVDRTVFLAGTPYYVVNTNYYMHDPDGGGYRVVAPPGRPADPPGPVGERLNALPPGFRTVYVEGREFYVVVGRFYRYDTDQEVYIRVTPPSGATLKVLPPSYETMHYKGEEVYVFEGAYYRYEMEQELYIVIEPPE